MDFEEVIAEIKKTLLNFYKVSRKKDVDSCEWNGPSIVRPLSHIIIQPKTQLSKQVLLHHEEQGREPIDVILGLAYQLGICKGYESAQEENKPFIELTELLKRKDSGLD